jgi:hypothetical protein
MELEALEAPYPPPPPNKTDKIFDPMKESENPRIRISSVDDNNDFQ